MSEKETQMALESTKCYLDTLPDEIHLNILTRLHHPHCLELLICCMQSYPRWRMILQGNPFIQTRFQNYGCHFVEAGLRDQNYAVPGNPHPSWHQILNLELNRGLVITTRSDGRVSSVTIKRPENRHMDEEGSIRGVNLVGPGILDDPLFFPTARGLSDVATFTDTVENLSIAFARQDAGSRRLFCSVSDQWPFTDLQRSGNITIRRLVDLSVKLALTEAHLGSNKAITVILKITACMSYGYAFFGGLIIGDFRNAERMKDQSMITTATPIDYESEFQPHLAVKAGNIVLLKQLIRAGVPFGRRDDAAGFHSMLTSYATPLHLAVISKDINALTVLLDAEADTEILNRSSRTPLQVAVYFNSLEVVKLLVRRGANIEAGDPATETTPLHLAVKLKRLEILKVLVECGANVDANDENVQNAITLCYSPKSVRSG